MMRALTLSPYSLCLVLQCCLLLYPLVSVCTANNYNGSVSFDMSVIGCRYPNNSQYYITFEIISDIITEIQPSSLDLDYPESCSQTKSFSYNFKFYEDVCAVQFTWLNSIQPSSDNITCCWSISNVVIQYVEADSNYGGNNMIFKVCSHQTSHLYNDKTWVCHDHDDDDGQQELIGICETPNSILNVDCKQPSEAILEFSKWAGYSLCHSNESCGSFFNTNTNLFSKIYKEIEDCSVNGLKSLLYEVENFSPEEIVFLMGTALNTSINSSQLSYSWGWKKFSEIYLNVSNHVMELLGPKNETCIESNETSSSIMTEMPPPSSTAMFTSPNISSSPVTMMSPSFSISSMVPTPTMDPNITCDRDDVWPKSYPGVISLSTGDKRCLNGTAEAIRQCLPNGEWSSDATCDIDPLLNATLNQILSKPVDGIRNLAITPNNFSSSQTVFLISTALTIIIQNTTDLDDFIDDVIDGVLNISTRILGMGVATTTGNEGEEEDRRAAVSQLLQSLDLLALNLIEPSNEIIKVDDILFLRVIESNEMVQGTLVGIEVDNNSISLPRVIYNGESMPVRVASFFFPELSNLLPPRDTDSSIISPIISSTIDCLSCPVTDLTENVTIQLQIERLELDNKIISCAFYDFESRDGLLNTGDWNTSGCTTTEVNGDLVTCSCNHLTHFAILLSPAAPEISPIHYDVLNIIGLVLVPISLLCMVLVILTYTLIRSLWSIRNYIHIMLCASLFMAQLAFILGVDKIENHDVCSAVAVVLVYLFLVSFMWMLMEGVVLYVTLIRVFITNHKYYSIAFTIISYALPAVYLSIITPIGYLIKIDDTPDDKTHFLYYTDSENSTLNETLTACWLNYSTGFIWSFIAPVIVIILVNIGFFVMAVFVMRKHMKKHQRKSVAKFRHWLQVTISLTVVMGIAWLVGVLAFRKELLPIVYLTAVFIAAQGIIIFIILVPLSKQVREAYYKIWVTRSSQSKFLSKISTQLLSLSGDSKGTLPKSWNSNGGKSDHSNGRAGGIVLGTFDNPVNSTLERKDLLESDTLTREPSSVVPSSTSPELNHRSFHAIENPYQIDTRNHGNAKPASNQEIYENIVATVHFNDIEEDENIYANVGSHHHAVKKTAM